VFFPREVIFSKLFYCSSRRHQKATEAVKKCFVFRGGTVFPPPAGDFFEAVLLQQPQATEAVEKNRKNVVFLGFQTTR